MPKYTAKDVSTRLTFQGAWECSAFAHGYLEHCQYFGYSKREAIRAFVQRLNGN